MYSAFQQHDVETAPERSKPLLRQLLEHSWPNGFYAVTAKSSETLTAYARLHKAFMASSFTNEEKTVICQSINVENQCHFCVPAHTYMAKAMKLDEAVSNALRDDTALPSTRLEALRDFTLLLLRNHGHASDSVISKFLSAGYIHQNMLEVVLGLAQKTISNYVNHLARTPVDKQYEHYAWKKVE